MSRRVRPAVLADLEQIAVFLEERGMRTLARLEELVDPLADPAVVAEDDGRLVGVLTYRIDGRACEVTTLYAATSQGGIGTALLEAAEETARAAGCDRLWLITSNDNIDALRFYQRRGFRLAEVHVGAVDRSRKRLKPTIPELGDYEIPIHDELLLERRLD